MLGFITSGKTLKRNGSFVGYKLCTLPMFTLEQLQLVSTK